MGKNRMNRRNRMAGICLAAVCAVTGCAGCSDEVKLSSSTKELTAEYWENGDTGNRNMEVLRITNEDKEPGFAVSYLDFSLELLRQSRSGENVMVSPASVLLALEMTRCGAKGETLSQMNEVLYPGITPEQGKEGSMALYALLDRGSARKDAVMSVADSVWIHTDDVFVPDEEFLRTVAADYCAQIYGAPFDETTRVDVNHWVEKKTDGQIRDILAEISEDTMMYLINAVSFDGKWEEPYEPDQVHDAVFYGADGS